MKAFLFNGDFESEIAAWPAAYAPGRGALARNRVLAEAARPLLGGGDILVPIDELPGRVDALDAWGAAPSVAALTSRLGVPIELPPFDVVRRVNSKLWSHDVERALGIALDGATVVRTIDGARAALRACPAPRWVLKEPFGVAGRGRLLGRGAALDDAGARWTEKALARAGADGLVFEPWLEDVEAELGVQLAIPRDGAPRIEGVTRTIADGGGNYFGSIVSPTAPALDPRIEAAARAVATRLQGEGYFGPAGIDALVLAGGRVRPIVEVNARHTMGQAALRFAPIVPEGWLGAWVVRAPEPFFAVARDEAALLRVARSW